MLHADDLSDLGEEPTNLIEISVEDWLGTESDKIDHYILPDGRALKLASITDAESDKIRKDSRRLDVKTKTLKVNLTIFKRALIAHSIRKAYGLGEASLLPDQIAHRPLGELTSIMKAVMKVSGMDDESDKPDPESLFD